MHNRTDADVIILSWDRAEMTIEAIDSAMRQSGVRKTVKVVDQGSSLESLSTLRQYIAGRNEVELRELGANSGVPGGRNVASGMGQGRIIVALDSDAEFATTDLLRRVVTLFEDDPRLGAIGFKIVNYWTREIDLTSWDYPPRKASDAADTEFLATRFVGAGHAIRRDAFEAVGGYDAELFFCAEELDLSFKLINRGYHIKYAPDLVVLHKVAPENRVTWNGKRFFYSVRNGLYVRYKFGASMARLLLNAMTYALWGARNGFLSQAMGGIGDAVRMMRRFKKDLPENAPYRLGDNARAYIRENELKWTAQFWRSKLTLFDKL